MTDVTSEIADLVQQCHKVSLRDQRATRGVAIDLVDALPDGELLRRLAAEFLVDATARAARARTLEKERQAVADRQRDIAQANSTPEALVRRRQLKAERDAEELRDMQMFHGVLGRALDRYAEDLRVRWTAELLDSTFTLSDGTPVTWGDATVEQHAERRQMFLNNAHANMEGAARHELALRELEASGKPTLREMVGVAA